MEITTAEPKDKEIVTRSGRGYLERYHSPLGELRVAHVAGSAEEMGRQYGALLAPSIKKIHLQTLGFFSPPGVPEEFGTLVLHKAWDRLRPHVEDRSSGRDSGR